VLDGGCCSGIQEKEVEDGEVSMELTGKMRLAGFAVLPQGESALGGAEGGSRGKNCTSEDPERLDYKLFSEIASVSERSFSSELACLIDSPAN
jgi:hypothetical protein